MASEVDICNLALARLGDNATVASINPPEGSAQAEHCERFYPVARDALLEKHPWRFAVRRVRLAKLNTETGTWAYAYAEPSDVVRLLTVLPASAASDADSHDYEAESSRNGTPTLLTDLDNASLRYVARITDTTVFSPLFVDALAWLLASYLAGPVLKGTEGASMTKTCLELFSLLFSQAAASDSNQRQIRLEHDPAWISGR